MSLGTPNSLKSNADSDNTREIHISSLIQEKIYYNMFHVVLKGCSSTLAVISTMIF